jgi:hypothetical protein
VAVSASEQKQENPFQNYVRNLRKLSQTQANIFSFENLCPFRVLDKEVRILGNGISNQRKFVKLYWWWF